jgi:hypothetical protein
MENARQQLEHLRVGHPPGPAGAIDGDVHCPMCRQQVTSRARIA